MVITTVPPEVLCPQYVVIDQDQDDALEREHSDLTLRILCTQRMYLPRIPFSSGHLFPSGYCVYYQPEGQSGRMRAKARPKT